MLTQNFSKQLIPSHPLEQKSAQSEQLRNESIDKPSFKYLLQSSDYFGAGQGKSRNIEEQQIIEELSKENQIFKDLNIDLSNSQVLKEICKNMTLLYSQNPQIAELKEGEIYLMLQGHGFEYMQNKNLSHQTRLSENNDYIMIRKIKSNEYFVVSEGFDIRYENDKKKYQLMIDENTLLGKISNQIYTKHFLPKVKERIKKVSTFLKKISIFQSMRNAVFQEFARFMKEENFTNSDTICPKGTRTKDVYFVKQGKVSIQLFETLNLNQKEQTQKKLFLELKSKQKQSLKPTVTIVGENEVFGLQEVDSSSGQEVQIKCLSDCSLLKIDKRILAIIIASHDEDFKRKQTNWSFVNINNQIEGQNYSSPEKELLAKNVERIKTSQKKIRDIKLKCLASKKQSSNEFEAKYEIKREPIQQENEKSLFRKTPMSQRVMNRKKIQSHQSHYNSVKCLQNKINPSLLLSSRSESLQKFLYHQNINNENFIFDHKMTSSINYDSPLTERPIFYSQAKGDEVQNIFQSSQIVFGSAQNNKLTLRHKVLKQDRKNSTAKLQTDIIRRYIDQKVKGQIKEKAQLILKQYQRSKEIGIKNIKRKSIISSSSVKKRFEENKKASNDGELLDKMSNICEYPLVFLIETERKRMEKSSIVLERSKSVNGKIKKKQDDILIKDNS